MAIEQLFSSEDRKRAVERGIKDLHLAHGAIDAAVEIGWPLDENFIHELTRERYELASKEYVYSGNPGAGASLETSESIVRNLVKFHLFATAVNK